MKKRIKALIAFMVMAAAIGWFFYPLRSLFCMSVYSARHENKSVMQRVGIDIDIPSGDGWYPFVLTYNAEAFGEWAGLDAEMSIMYNFGAFGLLKRTSSVYDTQSERYSSFYGAYVVQEDDGVFGFLDDGTIDDYEVTLAVRYDYTQLVISAFGCEDILFEIPEFSAKPGVEYLGSGGWTCIDATILVNGVAHEYNGYKMTYLQYGRPLDAPETDFAPVTLYGRVYAKYLTEYDCTVMLYVIAPSEEAVETCDESVLSKTQIDECVEAASS